MQLNDTNPMSDEELYNHLDAIRQSLRPTCPGCNAPILWIEEQHPYCACGCLLYWPTPERI